MKSFSKSNFVKVLGATTLATLMATVGVFAFAPFNANAETSSSNLNLNNNSTTSTTESTGLITPHADDPVLFTTESGLEIKYGNATIQGTMSSGNLSGFCYFNTTANSKTYTWVLIGFGGIVEAISPAGVAINSNKFLQVVGPGARCSDDLNPGEYLFLSNTITDQVIFDCYHYANFTYSNSTLLAKCTTYGNSDYFGLGSLYSKLVTKNIVSVSTANGVRQYSAELKVFIMDADIGLSLKGNFLYSDFLSPSQFTCESGFHIRSMNWQSAGKSYYFESGSLKVEAYQSNVARGVRPCFVLGGFGNNFENLLI